MRRHTMVRVLGLVAWLYGTLVIGSPAAQEQLGKVHFPVSCSPAAQAQFDRAMALLHSFFYPGTVKAFTAITETEPGCAMAYWGLAMSIRRKPPDPGQCRDPEARGGGHREGQGRQCSDPARAGLDRRTRHVPSRPRHGRPSDACPRLRESHGATIPAVPGRQRGHVFRTPSPSTRRPRPDKTYARQLKAGATSSKRFAQQPDHPGVAHYIIHSYDDQPLAARALPAARHDAGHRTLSAARAPHALTHLHSARPVGPCDHVEQSCRGGHQGVRCEEPPRPDPLATPAGLPDPRAPAAGAGRRGQAHR